MEWSYKDVHQRFAAKVPQQKMKSRESAVEKNFIASVLLWNLKVVLGYGIQTSALMGGCPPSNWAAYTRP